MPSRRGFLTLAGGGVVLAAGAAVGLTAFPIGLPNPAAAWVDPGAGESDIRRKALSYALLAPNPHNMQPWRADLREAHVITLSLDTTRLLPATDPDGRQIIIGCGAFLALLEMAAKAFGASTQTIVWPMGEPPSRLDDRPFARVTLAPAPPAQDPLFAHVLQRRTNRAPYDLARIPAKADLAAITAQGAIDGLVTAAAATDENQVGQIRDIVWRGWLRELATPAAHQESIDVMRIGDRAIAAHRDGISLSGPMINVLSAVGMITRDSLSDPQSAASQQGAAQWKAMVDTAPAFLWQTSMNNTRTTQLAVGGAYLRLNLEAQARGLAIHPWSMALQEYPAMADLYAEQQAMLGATPAAPVQMLVRIGHPLQTVPASPRRELAAFMTA
jgi:hypothetical protein